MMHEFFMALVSCRVPDSSNHTRAEKQPQKDRGVVKEAPVVSCSCWHRLKAESSPAAPSAPLELRSKHRENLAFRSCSQLAVASSCQEAAGTS
eukprot:s8_g53.t1